MIDNYVRDSENVIKMYLTSTGTGDAILEKNISLYVGSYQNKLINVFIPKSILFENEENTFNYAVSVSAIMTSDTGKKVTSKPYYLSHLKDASLLDPQTQEMTDYVVLERVLPKEFTVYVGTTTVVINVINLDNTDDPTTLDIVTSQVCYLQVQESDYADGDEEVEPSEFQTLVSRVTTLEANVDLLDNVISTGENFVTSLTENKLPTNEELDAIVNNVEQRKPRNGDVIIFTLTIENETDKSYKYFYSAKGWDSYQIPLIEPASNGSLGIVQGTYSTSDEDVTTTEVNIRNGKILNVYVGLDGKKQDLGEIFNETIPNKYLNKEVGASKQFVRDYAMPRQFNDVDFIASTGYQDNVPTEPESGVQFTRTTDAIGDFEIFQIEKTNTADFELSSKNGYSNTIYISANANCKVTFRLTTRYKKVDEDWRDLNIELSNAVEYEANDIQKVVFSNPFTYLGEDVVDFKNGDMIQQTLEVITQTSASITFSVYSNEVYPSSFTLTSQYFVPSATNKNIAKILVLGVDGIIENNRVIFEVQNADDLVEFRTNQREFLLFGYLPVVGTLDDSLPVNITFGDTTYNVYTFMNGGNQPITIGDLKSVMSYNENIGYRFYPKMMFIETADIQGFVVEPSTVTASQLINVIDDTDTIVIGLDSNKVKLNLSAEIVNKLSRMLVTPMSKPAYIELVGIGTDGMQAMLELGDGFSVENGKINVTARGESYDDTEIRRLITELRNDKADIDEIPMNASDVGALPDTTKYGAGIDLTIDSSTYVVTAQLKDQNGNNLGVAKTIDLPLESVVVGGRYDTSNKKVILTLQNDTEISFSVADLVSGLASSSDLANYLPLSGGTITGDVTFNKDIIVKGNIMVPTVTHETSNPVRIATITSGGHIRYRTPTEIKSDLGISDTSDFVTETELNAKGYATQTELNATNTKVSTAQQTANDANNRAVTALDFINAEIPKLQKRYVTETYRSGTTWYIKYSDGWKECGLNSYTPSSWTLTTVTLPLTFTSASTVNIQVSRLASGLTNATVSVQSVAFTNLSVSSSKTTIQLYGDSGFKAMIYACGY